MKGFVHLLVVLKEHPISPREKRSGRSATHFFCLKYSIALLFASKQNELDNVKTMDGKRLIEKIRLRNILSFGEGELQPLQKNKIMRRFNHQGEELELLPLNVIIGQNASGKSNLIDVIKLLRETTEEKGLASFLSSSGGINEWIWKGNKKDKKDNSLIEVTFSDEIDTVKYSLEFGESNQRLRIEKELIENLGRGQSIELIEDLTFLSDSILSKPLKTFIEKDKYFAYVKTRDRFKSFVFSLIYK